MCEGAGSGVRLSERLAAVSLGTDLGMGHPMEHVLRQSVIALRLAERLGLTPTERECVYYSSLLAWVGCHVDAYEQAKWFGDDLALKHEIHFVDEGRAFDAAKFVLRRLGAGRPAVGRVKLAATFAAEGRRVVDEIADGLSFGGALALQLFGRHPAIPRTLILAGGRTPGGRGRSRPTR